MVIGIAASFPPDTRAADDCTIAGPSISNPNALVVSWALGVDETQPPALEISLPAAEGLTVEARFRLGFDGAYVSWVAGPWTPGPQDLLVETVDVPAAAFWDPDQGSRLSSMVVEVWAWQGPSLGQVATTTPLRVAFPYGAADPVFLDKELVESLAPGGVLVTPGEPNPGAWETTEIY